MAVLISVDAKPFDYEAVAELFPARSKKFNRQLARYQRFERAADALQFAIEVLPPQLFLGAYLEVEEERFNRIKRDLMHDQFGISLRRRSPADRDDTLVAFFGEQKVKAGSPNEPRSTEDHRCLSSHSSLLMIVAPTPAGRRPRLTT